jgi:uncharacterized protein YoxC
MKESGMEELLGELNTELEDVRIKSEQVQRKQKEVDDMKALLQSKYVHVGKALKGIKTKNPIIQFFTF